jgi:sortase A
VSPVRCAAHRWSRRAWQHGPVIATLLAILFAAVVTSAGGAAIPDPGWSVTATSPTSGLPDGRTVTVNVKANPEVTIFDVEVRQCRAGVSYQERADVLPPAGKCPDKPVSSTADQVVLRGGAISDAVHTDAGASVPFKVGVGTVPIVPIGGGPGTLTCDQANPCTLVVQIHLSGHFEYATVPLTFVDDEVDAACGGAAPGVLASGGSDQMQDAWAQWTKDVCQRPGAAGAPSRAAFLGEGAAVQAFAGGQLDLAYTAAGYDAAVGLAAGVNERRAAVATPVALNAAVIAVGGGYITPSGAKAPYPEIKMTAAEVSALFGGGLPWVIREDQPYAARILGRNPVLGGFLSAQVPTNRPMLPSEAESSTWFVTNFLTQRSPADWIAPRDGNQRRGAVAAAATAEPKFADDDTYSGRPVLSKVTDAATASVSTNGPIWALTDLATAQALGMTPVSIENANGEFVRPTPESMAAAVSTMKTDENGLLLPDPGAVASTGARGTSAAAAVTPYPLTYVEYAFAPAEPLVDVTTCTARSASQALLTSWLGYLVGDGQSNLPAGFAALPPALVAQATQTVNQVGAAPVTGTCAGSLGTGSTGSPSGAGGASGGTGIPSGSVPSGLTALGRTGAPTGSAAAAAADTGKDLSVAIPAFAGHKLADTTGNVVALVGIVLITSLAAWVTAGRRAGVGTFAMAGGAGGSGGVSTGAAPARSNVGGLVLLWLGVALAGVGLVVYQLGPLLQQRDQRDLLSEYRTSLRQASHETAGLPGASTATKPPADGDPVGVVEIGELQAQQVVVEGVTPSETRKGPGHVPGTAGLGQPGNSAVVARRNGFGASFANLAQLRKGDRILVTTTQGQTVYSVRTVSTRTIEDPTSEQSSSSAPAATSKDNRSVTLDSLYGPSKDDRLTLVTSASRAPWNSSAAIVAVARMVGKPFAPTPQNGRSDGETGRNAETGVWASVAFAVLLYGGAIAASIVLYRRMRFRVAYILTIAPLVALTVVTGETLSRLLPAWM